MLGPLIDHISKNISLSSKDLAYCERFFEPITVSKNELLERQDRVPSHLYFIHTGYVRLFSYNDKGDEVTAEIASPNEFITAFLNFIHQTPAKENLATITDCQLIRVSRANLKTFIDESSNFRPFSLQIFEQAIAKTKERAQSLATLNAKERYLKLLKEQPDIIHNVPIQYIASFLGIKPESLSRIRRGLIN